MISWILKKIVGSKNQREVKKLWPVVAQVNAIEVEYQKLTDDELRAKTAEFKQRIEAARQTRGIHQLYVEARKLEGELRAEDAKPIKRKAQELEQGNPQRTLAGGVCSSEEHLPAYVWPRVACARESVPVGDGAVRCADFRRHCLASREYCGNGHRRR